MPDRGPSREKAREDAQGWAWYPCAVRAGQVRSRFRPGVDKVQSRYGAGADQMLSRCRAGVDQVLSRCGPGAEQVGTLPQGTGLWVLWAARWPGAPG